MKIISNCKTNQECSCRKTTQMIRTYQANESGTIKIMKENVGGIEYLKAPVIMMVAGSRFGANQDSPFVYTPEVLQKYASDWEGMPVTVGHPVDNQDNLVSANSEFAQIIGRIESPTFENDSLKAVACFESKSLKKQFPNIYAALVNKEQIEVSIGLFVSLEEVENDNKNHTDTSYNLVVTEIIPDHLAVLMDVKGACSWEDGCGIRVNKFGKGNTMPIKVMISHLVANQLSYGERLEKIRSLVQAKVNENFVGEEGEEVPYVFVDDLFDDHAIIAKRGDDDGMYHSYQQNYTIDQDDRVVLEGEMVEVRKKISYMPFSQTETTETPETNQEEQEATPEVNMDTDKTETEPKANMDEDKEETVVINQSVINAVRKEVANRKGFLAELLGNQTQEDLEAGQQLLKEKRESAVKVIKANSAYTEEMLNKKPLNELQILVDAFTKSDFSLAAPTKPVVANEQNLRESEIGLLPILP